MGIGFRELLIILVIALLIFGVARGIIPPNQQESAAVWVLIVAIGLSNWAQFARTVRGATMVERQKDYVAAAKLVGRGPLFIMATQILPNVLNPIFVLATLDIAFAIMSEATLSFLGFGVQPPTPSWGNIIFENQTYFQAAPWLVFIPGAAIILLALAFNLVGDALRDVLDPTQRGRD